MTVRVYKSGDSGAPVLNGNPGSLINVLDACLVNGYGTKAAAGWTKPFTGTNLAAYQMPAGSLGYYLRVNDNAPAAQHATIVGYESMTDVNTGTNPFPTVAQAASGLYVWKSSIADAGARDWILITNGVFIYLYISYDLSGSNANANMYTFGQFTNYMTGDVGGCTINGMSTSGTVGSFNFSTMVTHINNTLSSVRYTNRSYTQAVGAAQVGALGDYSRTAGGTTMGASGIPYPNATNRSTYLSPIWLFELGVLRGEYPGFWFPLHPKPFNNYDTFDGVGTYAGKTFLVLNLYSGGQCLIETSNTW